MPSWLKRARKGIDLLRRDGDDARPRLEVPENLWTKCPECNDLIYHKELAANLWVCYQCGHHMAITWNVGEENQAPGTGFHEANTHEQRKEFASRIRALTYYNDHISVHNGPGGVFDDIFPHPVGYKDYTGPSLQTYLIKPKRKLGK